LKDHRSQNSYPRNKEQDRLSQNFQSSGQAVQMLCKRFEDNVGTMVVFTIRKSYLRHFEDNVVNCNQFIPRPLCLDEFGGDRLITVGGASGTTT